MYSISIDLVFTTGKCISRQIILYAALASYPYFDPPTLIYYCISQLAFLDFVIQYLAKNFNYSCWGSAFDFSMENVV